MAGEIPCFTLITRSLPAWLLSVKLVIDDVLMKVWALPSRPQSVTAEARRVLSVGSACLHHHLLGIAVGFMTYLGRERG